MEHEQASQLHNLVRPQRLVHGVIHLDMRGCPHIVSGLVQNHRDDLFVSIAFEIELRVDDFVKELVLGAGEDREGVLPS